jgi:hypothetical protein
MSQISEATLRARAKRYGYLMRKSRQSISLDNLGGYMLVDGETNGVVLGGRFDADLEDRAILKLSRIRPRCLSMARLNCFRRQMAKARAIR